MLSESDLYNSNTEPNNNVNPKSLGAIWINYSNGRHYICSNNTMNNNTWLDPIGILTNDTNNRINSINSNINNLTNDTNNRINTINSNINNLTNDTNNRINSNKSDINVTNRRIDNINIENNNNITSINRKINEINTRIDNINPGGLGYNQKWYNNFTRMPDVWYQNTASSPIAIMLTFQIDGSINGGNLYHLFLDIAEPNSINRGIGTIMGAAKYSGFLNQSYNESMFCVVPPTFYFRVSVSSIRLIYWAELK